MIVTRYIVALHLVCLAPRLPCTSSALPPSDVRRRACIISSIIVTRTSLTVFWASDASQDSAMSALASRLLLRHESVMLYFTAYLPFSRIRLITMWQCGGHRNWAQQRLTRRSEMTSCWCLAGDAVCSSYCRMLKARLTYSIVVLHSNCTSISYRFRDISKPAMTSCWYIRRGSCI